MAQQTDICFLILPLVAFTILTNGYKQIDIGWLRKCYTIKWK